MKKLILVIVMIAFVGGIELLCAGTTKSVLCTCGCGKENCGCGKGVAGGCQLNLKK